MNDYKVYKYTNNINNKIYIGQTCQSLQSRSGVNGNRYKACPRFYQAIENFGWKNFTREILKDNLSLEEANYWEKYYISYYNANNELFGYNMTSGGQNDIKGENNPFYGHKHSDETKRKMSQNHADVSGINNPMYGKHHSDISKQKISESRKDIYKGDKCSSYNREKPVKNITLNKIYLNAQNAAEDLGKDRRTGGDNISKVCRGKQKTAYGYEWKYITMEEYNEN